jgi:hypothetical protein
MFLFKTLEKLRLINSIKSGRRTSGANDFVVNEVCVCALIFSNKTQFDKYKNSSWWRLIRVIFKVPTGGDNQQKTPPKENKKLKTKKVDRHQERNIHCSSSSEPGAKL